MQKHDLKLADKADYTVLTRIVDRADIEVAQWADALIEIRDRGLYLFDHETFEDYCNVHCKRSLSWAQKILATERKKQAEKLIAQTTGEPLETKSNKSTLVAKVGGKVLPNDSSPSKDKPISSPLPMARAKKPVIEDKLGWPIPEKLHELWKRRDEPYEAIRRLKEVKQHLQAVLEKKDMMWVEVNFQSCAGDLDRCMRDIERARPHAVCPYCKGRSFGSCTVCNKRGLISEYLWRSGLNADKVFAMHKKEIEKYQNGKAKDV